MNQDESADGSILSSDENASNKSSKDESIDSNSSSYNSDSSDHNADSSGSDIDCPRRDKHIYSDDKLIKQLHHLRRHAKEDILKIRKIEKSLHNARIIKMYSSSFDKDSSSSDENTDYSSCDGSTSYNWVDKLIIRLHRLHKRGIKEHPYHRFEIKRIEKILRKAEIIK